MKLFFSSKTKNSSHLPVAFNNNTIKKYPHQKHLGILLSSKLDFKFHVDQKFNTCHKLKGLIRRLSVNVQGMPYSLYMN